eukprot:2738040-Rhodomonas_salina.1
MEICVPENAPTRPCSRSDAHTSAIAKIGGDLDSLEVRLDLGQVVMQLAAVENLDHQRSAGPQHLEA